MKYKFAKLIILVVWLLIIISLFNILPQTMKITLQYLGVLLLLAHLAEYFMFKKTIRKKPESAFSAFILTMIFGVFYWKF